MSSNVNTHIGSLQAASNWLIVALLAAILTTQVIILVHMPAPAPTLQALQDAKTPQARATVIRNIPLSRVHGGIEVTVENTPLEVELSR